MTNVLSGNTSTAKACFRALYQRNLSTHFMIDWDGTIYGGNGFLHETEHKVRFRVGHLDLDLDLGGEASLPFVSLLPGEPASFFAGRD